jgi:hypothetical protein
VGGAAEEGQREGEITWKRMSGRWCLPSHTRSGGQAAIARRRRYMQEGESYHWENLSLKSFFPSRTSSHLSSPSPLAHHNTPQHTTRQMWVFGLGLAATCYGTCLVDQWSWWVLVSGVVTTFAALSKLLLVYPLLVHSKKRRTAFHQVAGCAHRGGRHITPENTMASYGVAIKYTGAYRTLHKTGHSHSAQPRLCVICISPCMFLCAFSHSCTPL